MFSISVRFPRQVLHAVLLVAVLVASTFAEDAPGKRKVYRYAADQQHGFEFIEHLPAGWYWHSAKLLNEEGDALVWTTFEPVEVHLLQRPFLRARKVFGSDMVGFPTDRQPSVWHEFRWIERPQPIPFDDKTDAIRRRLHLSDPGKAADGK